MSVRRAFLAAALAAFALAARAAESATPIVVEVYHTNDVHGWIMPRPDKRDPSRQVGGAAALKALLSHDTAAKLVLDAGDWWQGTPEGTLSKGESVAEVFNAVGYDATEVGNHEFDAGADALRALIGKMRMPVLAANVYGPDGKRVPWTRPHVIKTVAGVKFGIFGLLTVHMDKLAFPKSIAGLTFRREVDEARDQVAALRKEGADVIIAVTHVGYEAPDKPPFEGDQTIAREVEGIDLIVGGHSHTALAKAWRDPAHGTLVVQAGSYLTQVGRTTLSIDPATRRVSASSDELLDLRPELGEDAAVKAIVDRRAAEVGVAFALVVATAAADMNRGAPAAESPIGSWMADCYKEATGADVAFQNGGGIRADMPAGPVTLRRIFSVMPFDNELVKLRMTGAQVRSALDHGVAAARRIQSAGIGAEYRRAAPRHERVVSATVGGAPLDDAKTYSVATLDFLVMGGDGYDEFGAAASREPTGLLARDVLAACARKQKTILPPPSGRLKSLGG
ncbi:MAG: bifunctional metallophosphatase/5'-nucleotidase [Elusimicrobiota bacterium]